MNRLSPNHAKPCGKMQPGVAVLIAFLQSGRTLDQASSVLLLAACVLSVALGPGHRFALAWVAVQCLAGLLEKYFAWRVALDARLFQILQQSTTPPDMTGAVSEHSAADHFAADHFAADKAIADNIKADNAGAGEPDYAAFDAALATMLGRTAVVPPRSMASRMQGARKLLLRQAACLAGQVLALAGLLVALVLARI